MPRKPVFVVTGTSGAGKGTLERELLARIPELELAISATTRDRREGEQDGREYWFISQDEFDEKLAAGEFLEHIVFDWGQRSGTLRSEIDRILQAGRIPLLDLETEGALAVAESVPGRSRSSSRRRASRRTSAGSASGRPRARVRSRSGSSWPAAIVGEESDQQQVVLALDEVTRSAWQMDVLFSPMDEVRRREYAMAVVRRRLHQPDFRRRVLTAYGRQCAICRLWQLNFSTLHISKRTHRVESPCCKTGSRCAPFVTTRSTHSWSASRKRYGSQGVRRSVFERKRDEPDAAACATGNPWNIVTWPKQASSNAQF